MESSGLRFGRLNAPLESSSISNDFVIDFTISRTQWDDESITFGNVKAGGRVIVRNDSGYSEIKIGFYKNGSSETKYFHSMKI